MLKIWELEDSHKRIRLNRIAFVFQKRQWRLLQATFWKIQFIGGSVVKNLPTNTGDAGLIPTNTGRRRFDPYQYRRRRFDPWVRKSPWRRKWQTTPVFLPGTEDREAWQAPIHGVAKDTTQWLSNSNNKHLENECPFELHPSENGTHYNKGAEVICILANNTLILDATHSHGFPTLQRVQGGKTVDLSHVPGDM